MRCPSCQRDNTDDAAYCNGCGSRLQIVCPKCGQVNVGDASFCNGCGTSVVRETPALADSTAHTAESQIPSPANWSFSSFAAGRHMVKEFQGEGAKKNVYLCHDNLLDRDVAFV